MIGIVATDEKFGIGKNNSIPWKISADLKYFKQFTMGKYIIMGRKTFESMGSKPLPGRTNIVISSTMTQPASGQYEVFSSLDDVVEAFGDSEDLVVIGGAQLFNEAFKKNYIKRLSISKIPGDYDCDVFFDFPYLITDKDVSVLPDVTCEKSGITFKIEIIHLDFLSESSAIYKR